MKDMDENGEAQIAHSRCTGGEHDSDDDLWDEYTGYETALRTVQQTLSRLCSDRNSAQTIMFGSLVCNHGSLTSIIDAIVRSVTLLHSSLV